MNTIMLAIKYTLKGLFVMSMWIGVLVLLVMAFIKWTVPLVVLCVTAAILLAAWDIGKAL